MANEVKVSVSISFSKNNIKGSRSWSCSADVTGSELLHASQTIGNNTEEELAQTSDMGVPGWCLIINHDTTNYIEIGSTTGVYDAWCLPGEPCLYRHSGSGAIYVRCDNSEDAGDALVEYFMVEA